jgi:translation initiation factor IF-2
MLEPVLQETVVGRAEVRALFRISKLGNIAGGRVIDGEIRRNARVRILREGNVLHDGEIQSLRHLQDDVREVRQGFEFGIAVKGFSDFAPGDMIECYTVEKVAAA